MSYTGWVNFSQGNKLCFCQLVNGDSGVEVTFSVAIDEDFTWTIKYKKHTIPCETSRLLKNIPPHINSGELHKVTMHCSYTYFK